MALYLKQTIRVKSYIYTYTYKHAHTHKYTQMCVHALCECACHVCAVYMKSRKGHYPYHPCELELQAVVGHKTWVPQLNFSPLLEQKVLLTTESSLPLPQIINLMYVLYLSAVKA